MKLINTLICRDEEDKEDEDEYEEQWGEGEKDLENRDYSEDSERASVALDLNTRNRLGGHVSLKNLDMYDTFMSGAFQRTDNGTRKESPIPLDTDDSDDLFMGTEDLVSQIYAPDTTV